MYEKEINLIDVSFIFHRKLASRECILRVSKNPQKSISVGDGRRSHVPGYMAQDFRLLGHWPTGQQFQNDH